MTSEETLTDIARLLKLIAALLLRQGDQDQTNAERIQLLNSFKLSNGEIADLLGMKPSAVSMAQSRLGGKK